MLKNMGVEDPENMWISGRILEIIKCYRNPDESVDEAALTAVGTTDFEDKSADADLLYQRARDKRGSSSKDILNDQEHVVAPPPAPKINQYLTEFDGILLFLKQCVKLYLVRHAADKETANKMKIFDFSKQPKKVATISKSSAGDSDDDGSGADSDEEAEKKNAKHKKKKKLVKKGGAGAANNSGATENVIENLLVSWFGGTWERRDETGH